MSNPVGDSRYSLRDVVREELRQAILVGKYKAGERLVEERIAELHAIQAAGTEAARAGSREALDRLNYRLHEALAAAGENRILADLTRSLRVLAGDEPLAELLATRHVLRNGDHFLKKLEEQ